MEKFKKALGNAEKVWFEISDEDKHDFLVYAKDIGCTWLNGKSIDPEHQTCNYHMSIHADLKIASVPYFAWFAKSFSGIKKLVFSDFLSGTERAPQSELIGEYKAK